MTSEYFNIKRKEVPNSAALMEEPKSPILTDEDERFLELITSDEQPPPLPERPAVIFDTAEKAKPKDAQIALMDGANKIPLPQSPPLDAEAEPSKSEEVKHKESKTHKKTESYLSYVRTLPQRFGGKKGKSKEQAGSDLQAAVEAAKKGEIVTTDPAASNEIEKTKEEQDLTSVLDQLNLSAVNNRAFSFSEKSQKMMAEFTQILKDIVNGVPTAYDDLEKFLKNWDEYLRKMYDDLPDFLKNLIKSLPSKMSASIAPGLLAAASEKPGADAKAMDVTTESRDKKHSKKKIPSLKKLVSAQGAVTGMLKSILNFLKLRFPAVVTGTNVLMSLAVFLLLFVFWYCHKRGKETRLEKERLAAQDAASDSDFEQTSSELEDSTLLENEAKVQRILNQPPPTSVSPAST
ncbi:uncharacterized protein PV09_01305 [Verruconis gallopava]|uniref:Uncharacterized protein n=1 Tax=Verruconis gallopava TaxID=253628 RepID=A0A0D2ANX3_9PEZI|nr:uncharacterized protein PV09_01305 [Verruconis gallopava]KIW08393.1 hypothetical protein PV09_01305 [Verruconis gallopava]